MNTESLNTLKQTRAAIQQLETANQDTTLTPDQHGMIEDALDALAVVEDGIINETMQAMIDKINSGNADLQKVIKDMGVTIDKLADVAATLKKVSQVIGVLSEITAKALSAGLI